MTGSVKCSNKQLVNVVNSDSKEDHSDREPSTVWLDGHRTDLHGAFQDTTHHEITFEDVMPVCQHEFLKSRVVTHHNSDSAC